MPDVQVLNKFDETFCVLKDRVFDGYTLLDAKTPEDENIVKLRPVGGGSYGVVVRARDHLGLEKAIKILQRDAGIDPTSAEFRREILLTNRQPFKHVVTIVGHGRAADKYDDTWSYYVSPYIEGPTLEDYFAELVAADEQILASATVRDRVHDVVLMLLRDVLDGIGELERAHIIHMDIKHTNILVYPRVDVLSGFGDARIIDDMNRPQAFIIDLGAGKSLLREPEEEGSRTKRIRTEYYFPEERNVELKLADGEVDFEALQRIGTEIDLFCCGRMFERLLLDRGRRKIPRPTLKPKILSEDKRRERLFRGVFGPDFELLEGLIDNLLSSPDSGMRRFGWPTYKTASQARQAFSSLPLKAARSVWSSELLTDSYTELTIRTGRDLVHLSSPLDYVVDHPSFQRLKRINQLSLVSEIFPDATHSRFSHSLRTFHLAKRFAGSLARRHEFRLLFDRPAIDLLLASALLHDVGQYHFSHTIEDLQKAGAHRSIQPLQEIPHDQNYAATILRARPDGERSLADILQEHGIAMDDMLYVIDKRAKTKVSPVLNLIRDVVSGVIDVDRVSYLLHDSERSGVPFGNAVDVDSLIQALALKWDPRSGERGDAAIGIEENGVSAAEALLTAVYWMYKDVYWRHTNRGFMAAVKKVFGTMLVEKHITIWEYLEATHLLDDVGALLYLETAYNEFIKRRRHGRGINPLTPVVSMKRLGYKRVFSLQRDGDEDTALFNALQRRPGPDTEAIVVDEIANSLPANARPQDGEILLDVPLKKRLDIEDETSLELGRQSDVWVRTRVPATKTFKDWVNLKDYSPLVAALGPIEDHGRKLRVFFATSLLRRLDHDQVDRLESTVLGALHRATGVIPQDKPATQDKDAADE